MGWNLILFWGRMELKDSIEINTTPEKLWDFFTDLEKNYTTWHPEDHIVFKWTEGKPMGKGSGFYAEQKVMGKIQKYKGTISESVPYRKIVFKLNFPMSLFSPKFEWQIKSRGRKSVFTAITYVRGGIVYQKLFKKWWEKLVKQHDKHTGEEAINLKKILEKTAN